MRQKGLLATVSFLVVLGLIIGSIGCAAPTPSPTPTPSPKPTPTPTPTITPTPTPTQVFKFSVANQFPATHLHSLNAQTWMDRMTKASNGQIQFNYFPAETLVKGADMFSAVQTGAVDIGYVVQVYFGGQEPLNDFSNIPLLFDSFDHIYNVLQDPGVREVHSRRFVKHNMVWLGVATFAPAGVFSKDKPLLEVADWKGMPARSSGGGVSTWMQNAGASVLNITSSELYNAADRGMVKAWITTYASQFSLGLYAVSKHITHVWMIFATNSMFMNRDAFNKLPKNLQQLLIDESKALEIDQLKSGKDYDAQIVKNLVDKGMVNNELTKAQLAAWQDLAKPIWKQFENSLGADGGLIMGAIDKYRK